ncbi:MAG: STAS domain-containing protein [Lachnospiraceae bacterium]|nr:STAS domain-containing protein [Lachnospiraceae bacterium]
MEKLKPKLFSVMKTYSKEQLVKDIVAGVIVAIIALPLSIALALASGVTPEKGIYTAIVAGFVISFLGGSRVQIAGPTAAFATIVAGIVAKSGTDGLVVATIMAGIILIIMGLCKFGSLIKFIPYTITTGFTAGIAVTIFIGQIKDFLGLTIVTDEPLVETMDKLSAVAAFIGTINWWALLIGCICLAILIVWPYLPGFLSKIPGSLIAVLASSALVALLQLPVNTIGDLYTISGSLPPFAIPRMDFAMVRTLLPDAFTIAILAGIESLLSCVVADGMIGSRHRSNMELVAQGAGNVASALFGGIPATGAIARTAANIKNGGRTPIAGMVHSVVLVLILVVLMPYAALIPMPAIAAILFMVAYNMSGWREFADLCKTAPKSDIIVLWLTFFLTVVFDLVVAIEVGVVLAAILFMKRMSEVTEVEGWKYAEDVQMGGDLMKVPKNTLVYEISGPMFFGAADKLLKIGVKDGTNCLILRMRSVNAIDSTAMRNFEKLLLSCQKKNVTLIFSHVDEQPMSLMHKAGFDKKVGLENFCAHIDDAIARAESLQ